MKRLILLFTASTLFAQSLQNTAVITEDSTSELLTTDSTLSISSENRVEEPIEKKSRAELYSTESKSSEEKSQKQRTRPTIQPLFSGGLQFFNSSLGTGTMALYLEAGAIVNHKHHHSIEGYWGLFDYNSGLFEIDRVWGTNYNYLWMNNFGTSFFRLDLGIKAGYNYYSEVNKITGQLYETRTYGGPRGQVNLRLGKLGLGGGYTMLLGSRENDGNHTSTRVDLWNVTFGVSI